MPGYRWTNTSFLFVFHFSFHFNRGGRKTTCIELSLTLFWMLTLFCWSGLISFHLSCDAAASQDHRTSGHGVTRERLKSLARQQGEEGGTSGETARWKCMLGRINGSSNICLHAAEIGQECSHHSNTLLPGNKVVQLLQMSVHALTCLLWVQVLLYARQGWRRNTEIANLTRELFFSVIPSVCWGFVCGCLSLAPVHPTCLKSHKCFVFVWEITLGNLE